MTKHKDTAKELTPEEAESLAQLEGYAEAEEEEPARFKTGGATASEIAAWREAHGVAPDSNVYAPGENTAKAPE